MMDLLLYVVSRIAMAVAALISVDALAETTLTTEPGNIAAGFVLIVLLEAILEANTK